MTLSRITSGSRSYLWGQLDIVDGNHLSIQQADAWCSRGTCFWGRTYDCHAVVFCLSWAHPESVLPRFPKAHSKSQTLSAFFRWWLWPPFLEKISNQKERRFPFYGLLCWGHDTSVFQYPSFAGNPFGKVVAPEVSNASILCRHRCGSGLWDGENLSSRELGMERWSSFLHFEVVCVKAWPSLFQKNRLDIKKKL